MPPEQHAKATRRSPGLASTRAILLGSGDEPGRLPSARCKRDRIRASRAAGRGADPHGPVLVVRERARARLRPHFFALSALAALAGAASSGDRVFRRHPPVRIARSYFQRRYNHARGADLRVRLGRRSDRQRPDGSRKRCGERARTSDLRGSPARGPALSFAVLLGARVSLALPFRAPAGVGFRAARPRCCSSSTTRRRGCPCWATLRTGP